MAATRETGDASHARPQAARTPAKPALTRPRSFRDDTKRLTLIVMRVRRVKRMPRPGWAGARAGPPIGVDCGRDRLAGRLAPERPFCRTTEPAHVPKTSGPAPGRPIVQPGRAPAPSRCGWRGAMWGRVEKARARNRCGKYGAAPAGSVLLMRVLVWPDIANESASRSAPCVITVMRFVAESDADAGGGSPGATAASPGVLAVRHRRSAPDRDISSNRTVPVAVGGAGFGG